MISEKMEQAFNNQINAEFYSAYLYLAMESFFQRINLTGFANWMRVQTQEELSHAMKFYDFVIERGGNVELQAIKQPAGEWGSPLDAFEAAYKHEKYISSRINDLVDLSIEQKDHASDSFLRWFVDEQVEEEASVSAVVEKLKLVKDAPGGQFMIDAELAKRVFTPPASE